MIGDKIQSAIAKIMADYADSFENRNFDAVTSFWILPATINVGDDVTCFLTKEDFIQNIEALSTFYAKQSVVSFRKSIGEITQITLDCVHVTTHDQLFDSNDQLIVSWRHYYILKQISDGQWRIAFAIADDEIRVWHARGTPLA